MPSTNRQLMQRASAAVADLTSAGVLTERQVQKFITGVIEQTTILKEVTVIGPDVFTDLKVRQPKLWIAGTALQPKAEDTELGANLQTAPSFGYYNLEAHKLGADIPLTEELLEDNPDKAKLRSKLMNLLMQVTSYDLERVAIAGDTTTYDDEASGGDEENKTERLLGALDGWLLHIDSDQITDASSADFDPETHFEALIDAVDHKYLRDRSKWRFYVAPKVRRLLRDWLIANGYQLSDDAILGRAPMTWDSIPVVEVPSMPVSGSGASATSPILLVEPKNLVLGFHRKMRVRLWEEPRPERIWLLSSLRADVAIQWDDALALQRNVKHTLASS
jgi:HK97 family phage major capsid protein